MKCIAFLYHLLSYLVHFSSLPLALGNSHINLISGPLSSCDLRVVSGKKWSNVLPLSGSSASSAFLMPYDSPSPEGGWIIYYINIVLWAVAPHLCSEVLRQQNFLQSHALVHFSNIAVGLVRFYFRWCNSLPATSTPLTANSTGSFHSHSSDRGILTAWAQLGWWMESSPVTWGINCMMETCILCGLQGKARLGIASAVGSNKDSACLSLVWKSYRAGRDLPL